MCEPPLQEGTVQLAAVQVLDLGEIGKFLQPCVECGLGCLSLWSGRQVQHAKPDEALGECWNIVRRHVIQCLQVRDDAVQDHGVA